MKYSSMIAGADPTFIAGVNEVTSVILAGMQGEIIGGMQGEIIGNAGFDVRGDDHIGYRIAALLDANIGTKAWYAVRTLKIDPKTKKYNYAWQPTKQLDNMSALAWAQSFPVGIYNERALYQWDGRQWKLVPGF